MHRHAPHRPRGEHLVLRGLERAPGGQVTVEGLVTYGPDEAVKAEPYYFAITGGTGQYQGARGQVKLEEVSADEVHATFLIDV